MTEDLLALLIALQHVTLDDNQRLSLQQLSNKCANFVRKPALAEDWQNIQHKIKAILEQNSQLKARYQPIQSQLQSLNFQELQKLLPNSEALSRFKPKLLETLGYTPASFPSKDHGNVAAEIENIVMELATIILKQENPSEISQELMGEKEPHRK